MATYRYPRPALTGDYLRAGIGTALFAGPGFAIPAGSMAQLILFPVAGLFVAFGVRTWQRGIARVEMSDSGISLSALRRVSLSWRNLSEVRLSYYSTKSDRAGGWMQLTLKGHGGPDGGTIRVDSNLEGFEEIARRAATATRHARVNLSETTRTNFSAMGIDVDD